MKIVVMLVFAALAGVVSVNAAEPALNFGGRGGAAAIAVPEAGAPQIIPGRTFRGGYDFSDVSRLDKALDKTIANAEKNNSPRTVAALKCLRRNGTAKQKTAFVYAAGTYAFPETCESGSKARKSAEGDSQDCVEIWTCRVTTETVLKWTCDAEGRCSEQPVEVMYETCYMDCE
ncbi:MAG TPA: hypothetical protein DCW72_03985 [Elusimicrobia bacterium]|nr:MAG: hypothetical protein A2X29_10750 [Elusimicrobia bacterium GWA2_64_40]OGR62545.1 MAG: hypothetical protein A2X30_07880 [Elusimicrobia bacterium GWB2_63_16]HAN05953.1 hypothetical protein [Elusimicrobiota bacterium]HAU89408.1 hypothetical protein [Elusimicrobiota bacterium]